MKTHRVDVVIKPWEEGGFLAEAPAIQGCWMVAPDVTTAMEQIIEVVKMHLEVIKERREPLPKGVAEVSESTVNARVAVSVT